MTNQKAHEADAVHWNGGTMMMTFRPGGPERPMQSVHADEARVRAFIDSVARDNPEVLLSAVLRAVAERGATAALDRRERR